MKSLLEYILKNITESKFSITETSEGDQVTLTVEAPQDEIGLIIGKHGQTIKALQDLLKVKAKLENKFVSVSVSEKASSAV